MTKIHTFTGPGRTFTVSGTAECAANDVVSYMVVAGGGSGAKNDVGGGGGAGGFREVVSPSAPYTASPLDGYPSAPNRITVTAQAYPITVGGAWSTSYRWKYFKSRKPFSFFNNYINSWWWRRKSWKWSW